MPIIGSPWRALVSLLALAATVTAVLAAPVPAASRAAQVPAAQLPSFYEVPTPLPAGEPGAIVKSEVVPAEGLHGTLYRVMYHSRSVQGADIAVTGLVVVPEGPAPAGGWPVMSWAHGTTGIADSCAPSLDAAGSFGFANRFLDDGWVVVATDYEGLGTPGRHPYVVGDSEARGVIDNVRAAASLGVELSGEYVVWGHSQGGHAAMFALDIAREWAPELNLLGVVAGAPPSQLNLVYDYLIDSPYKYYLLMVGAAINAAYGDEAAPLDEVMLPEGRELIDLVDQGCTGFLADRADDVDVRDVLVQQPDGTLNPFSNPVWGPLIAAQDPANFTDPSPVPLLLIHGGADEQIPNASSAILAGQLCGRGQQLERWSYPGQSHAGVIGPSFDDMLSWMDLRRSGQELTLIPGGDVERSICSAGKMVDVSGPVPPPTTSPDGPPTGLPFDPDTAPGAAPIQGAASYTG